jgi:hypothetical protein
MTSARTVLACAGTSFVMAHQPVVGSLVLEFMAADVPALSDSRSVLQHCDRLIYRLLAEIT